MTHPSGSDPMAGAHAASRPPPAEVAPVVLDGIRYEQARAGLPPSATDTSGWLRAVDIRTGAQLWLKQIYTAPPVEPGDPMAAGAPRTDYMTRLEVQGASLLVVDELGRRFRVDPRTGATTPLR